MTIPSQQSITLTLQQAIAYHKAGQLQAAKQLYCAILQAHPQHQDANHNLGVLSLQMKQPFVALPYLKQALEINQGQGQFWISYIDALMQAGKMDDASRVLRQGRQVGLRGTAVDDLERRLVCRGQNQVPVASPHTDEANASVSPASPDLPKNSLQGNNVFAKPATENTTKKGDGVPGSEEMATVVSLFNQGLYAEAESLIRALTVRYPLHGFGWKALAIVLRRQRRGGEALAPMMRAVQLMPEDADAHYNLGNILKEQGRVIDAEVSYRQAIRLNPGLAVAYYNLANIHQDQGRFVEAESCYRQALAIKPDHAEAHCNLGNSLQDQGRAQEAEACYRRALAIKPDYAGAYSNLGLILHDQGQLSEAEACHRRALEIKPDYIGAYNNLGLTLKDLGRLNEAESCYRQALAIKPDYTEAYNNLGNILKEQGRLSEAETCYRQALAITPSHAEAHNNLGITLREQGRLTEAETSYLQALAVRPDYVDALNNLGNTIKEQGRLVEAETIYRRALAISPNHAEAHNNLGNILKDQGRLHEAEFCFRQALTIKPGYVDAFSNLLGSLNYTDSHSPNFCREEAERYGRIVAAKVISSAGPFSTWLCPPQPSRLRVGLVSGDLRSHPVGYFLESLLAHIDPALIELVAYPTYHKEDALTNRIRPCFSSWKPLFGLSDEASASLIRNDGIHILVDLSGHTAYNRLPVFAWCPAPVQVSWLGYFATTGVAEIDYLLADETGVPEAQQGHFTEKVWCLPDTRLCFTPPDIYFPISSLPAIKNGYITFGCFQALAKVDDKVLAIWGQVLSALPHARLRWQCKYFSDPQIIEQTLLRLVQHGIPSERAVLKGPVSRKFYLEAYAEVDIVLDTFPYPGGTTTCEALWMGVPTITLAGGRMHSRQGASLLTSAGLGDWVAWNKSEYVCIAVNKTKDIPALSNLRNGLRNQVLASPIFNAEQFAKKIEVNLWGMWREKMEFNKLHS